MNFFAALFVSSTIIMTVVQIVFHTIEEGYVGVYYRGGALLSEVSHPGFHFMMPMMTVRKRIQITLRTDVVKNISCGVSGGVLIIFDRIEVDSILSIESVHDIVRNYTADYAKILISDKIHHELNQFCSIRSLQEVNIVLFDQIGENLRNTLQQDLNEMAPGLKIQAVRVTKPYIPRLIRKFYELMEEQRTKLLIATEHQKVVEKDAETDRKRAAIEAETEAYIATIRYGQKIMEKQALQEIAHIEDSMYLAAEQNKADANFYHVRKQAEANFVLLTPTYMELKKNEALNNNTILYYGPNIPKMFVVDSCHVSVTKVEVGKDEDS